MKAGVACLIALVIASPAFGQDSASAHDSSRGRLFWSGLALGVAGVTTSVLGVTVRRVDDNSSGNAPPGTYQACIAQRSDPIYASNSCESLRAKNLPMLYGGVAVSALGAVLMIRGAHTTAEVTANGFRLSHTIRF